MAIIEEEKLEQEKNNECEGKQNETSKVQKRKKRITNFPNIPYENCLEIANAIWKFASGQRIRRITLFDNIGKSPESGPSRSLVSASSKYGITTGGYQADYLELTPDGALATNPEGDATKKIEATLKLAILNNEYFSKLYNQFKDMKLPSKSVMEDYLEEIGLPKEECSECVEIFVINCKYIGAIQLVAGSERILTIDHMLEKLQLTTKPQNSFNDKELLITSLPDAPVLEGLEKWNKICFYITPIGDEDSVERQHADLFLNHIIEPVLSTFGFEVVRADKINSAGLITSQIIEHIIKSKLVVADLSFHNPNVFYELSLRHARNLPAVHIIRKADKIPFDITSFRTVVIDTASIYTLVPQLDTYRTQISSQIRQILDNPDSIENPISAYLAKTKLK